MKDISIEYAHIYTNNKIDHEHTLSLEILSDLQKEFSTKNKTTDLVILVDDYSFPDPTFDYEDFIKWLGSQGYRPDLMLRESQLIPACDITLKKMADSKLKEQIIDYVKVKKYPCSLFIATWYLLRLGRIQHEIFENSHVTSRLINIIPISFKPFEDKAIEIIATTPFSDAIKNIEYKYFEGRMLA